MRFFLSLYMTSLFVFVLSSCNSSSSCTCCCHAFVIIPRFSSLLTLPPEKVLWRKRIPHQRRQGQQQQQQPTATTTTVKDKQDGQRGLVVVLPAVANNDTETITSTSTTATLQNDQEHEDENSDEESTKKKKSNKRKGGTTTTTVLPFLRVHWSNTGISAQWEGMNDAAGPKEKDNNDDDNLPVRRVATLAPRNFTQNNNNKNENQTQHVVSWKNNTVVFDKNTINATTTSTTNSSPIPVAESLLKSLYGKAFETSTAWDMSQFFPIMTTTPLVVNPSSTAAAATTAVNQSLWMGDKKATDPLTVQDLERILAQNGFVRQVDVAAALQQQQQALNLPMGLVEANSKAQSNTPIEGLGLPVSDRGGSTKDSASSSSSEQVAFPQPSVLSYNSLKWGVTAASFLSCTILATSILPSLWLMGGLVGSVYGYQTGKRLVDGTVPTSFFPAFLLVLGKKLTKWYLQVYDMFNAMFFMYKTGQLSYSMWRRYAEIDDRFQIQDKIDAWNAVFIEGKENFDKWEKENEVGRKVLATLRTAWLVEERSLKKKGLKRLRKRSKYRVVQIIYDTAYFAGRFVSSLWRLISGGGTSQELSEFLRGIRLDISAARLDSIGARLGAIVAAIIGVNIAGALFTISPPFLMLLAVVMGLVWPTWFPELWDRCRRLFEDTRARGRGEDEKETRQPALARGVDKSRYHFYIDRNGKKKYYRVTQAPVFRQRQDSAPKGFRWPWQKPPEPQRKTLRDFFG